MPDPKVAVVTGASSGFGQLTAERLSDRGWRVFGTSRQQRDATRIEMRVLDVRSGESVGRFVDDVLRAAGRVDLLVNNAGATHVSLAEETALGEAEALFQTNFFGAVRMTNAVLPSMRDQRRGRIINVGSLAGLVGVPGQAFYAASKHALEGYAESLRYELEPLGISVSIVEPGFYRTALHERVSPAARRIPAYDRVRSAVRGAIERSFAEGGDPADVAELIARVAEEDRPGLRYRVGKDARLVPRLKKVLPENLFAIGFRKQFGLPPAT
ncbi:SDR family NAD(P)-dependent oxidoreductase [Rubrivirga sp.]|uniref:SDR family NAD(P)-dependent oxidoreductase n=1 Tax=Rubrivirga sp. TaxID=1885344 RepID=UPI003B51A2BD